MGHFETSKKLATVLLLLGALVLVNGVIQGEQSIQRYFELRSNLHVMNNTVDGLENENEGLQKEIRKLKTSPDYARKVLRDKYHLTEPNERIVFFSE